MNLNKKTYSDSNHLTREDINVYKSTQDEHLKHEIEKKSLDDDFDADALEGWSDRSLSIGSLTVADKKFLPSNKWLYILSTSVVVLAVAGIVVLSSSKETKPDKIQQATVESVVVEKTDIVLPDNIESMEELPVKEQIAVKTIMKDFTQQKEEQTIVKQETKIEDLPVKRIEESKPEVSLVKETLMGKEIYLSNLKLLDYRAYRSRPKITTKQMILTGTPANIGETTSTEEVPEWKDVEVPYIDYLEKTMEIFSKGQNKKALTRFVVILEEYPDDLNANFYAGLCYYNLKEFSNAQKVFAKCLDSKYLNFTEEAEWYLAKSLLADGKKVEALTIFTKISNANGYYSTQAKKIVSSL